VIKVDLVTGFLGSGKTTFIKKYAKFLMSRSMNVGILENDFGAINVDMMLLTELEGEHCDVEMIAGGCDRETHRRRFRTKLIAMRMCGYDRVIVEPSGIYDVDEFFDVLRDEPLDEWYEIGSVIALADINFAYEISDMARFILASEIACAGHVLLTHADESAEARMLAQPEAQAADRLNEALASIHCSRRLEGEVTALNLNEISDNDMEQLMNCGYVIADYVRPDITDDTGFKSVYLMNLSLNPNIIKEAVRALFDSCACGDIFRIKGFLKTENNIAAADGADGGNGMKTAGSMNGKTSWLELNATHTNTIIKPIAAGQDVLIVIGCNIHENEIRRILSDYQEVNDGDGNNHLYN